MLGLFSKDNLEGIFSAAAVAVLGAAVAGVTAWVKTWFVNRDEKTRAAEQLELASKRTEFAVQWLEANRTIAEDETTPPEVKAQAQEELDAAYKNAQNGFSEGRSAIQEVRYDLVVERAKALLLLRTGLSGSSKLLVALLYFCIFSLGVILGLREPIACDFAASAAVQEPAAADRESSSAVEGEVMNQPPESGPVPGSEPAPLIVSVDGPAQVASGKEATYTIFVENTGEGAVDLAEVTGTFGNTDRVGDPTQNPAPPDAKSGDEVWPVTWSSQTIQPGSRNGFSLTVEVTAGSGTDLTYQAIVTGEEDSAEKTVTTRTAVVEPCEKYRFVSNGWEWFFGAAAGTAALRLLFGGLVSLNERRRGAGRATRAASGTG